MTKWWQRDIGIEGSAPSHRPPDGLQGGMDVLPNQTIYISNVFEKLKKEGAPSGVSTLGCCIFPKGAWCTARLLAVPNAETKRLLYALFGRFGRILDIVVMRGERLRGQAWVVYTDVGAATEALRAMQDFPFYGKPLVSG